MGCKKKGDENKYDGIGERARERGREREREREKNERSNSRKNQRTFCNTGSVFTS